MKNVLILKFPYNSLLGGGELHTLSLVENLKKRGFNFYLVSSCPVLIQEFKKRNWFAKSINLGKEPVSPLAILIFLLIAPYIFSRLFFILLSFKIKKKTNILYCLTLTDKLLATIPACFLGYSCFWIEHLRIERWLLQNPLKFLYIFSSFFAKTIAVSKAVKNQLINLGLKKNKVKVIYNGVDIQKFKSQMSNVKTKDKKIIIGTVARLCPEKGINYLILAFKKVVKKFPKTELQIVGKGPERKNLEKLARELNLGGKVKFFGFQKDIVDFLNKIDIFALVPIRRESFGIAAAEAEACGKPVVATNISGLSEVVKNNKTGFIVQAKNTNQISQALIELIQNENLRKKMGENARKRVENLFTLEKMINEFEKEFKKK